MAKRNVDLVIAAKDRASAKLGIVGDSVGKLRKRLLNLKTAAVGALGGFAVGAKMQESLKLWGIQEKAIQGVSDALRVLGKHSAGAMEEAERFADSMQAITAIGDETVLEMMRLGAGIGRLSGQALQQATMAAIGLGRSLRVDTVTAMRLVSRAAVGDTGTLKRYGIQLTETATDQEKFNELLQRGAEAFVVATGEAKTGTGRIEQFQNAVGDLKEVIGKGLVPIFDRLVERGRNVAEMLQHMTKEDLAEVKSVSVDVGATMIGVWAAPKLIKGIGALIAKIKGVGLAAAGMSAAVAAPLAILGAGLAYAVFQAEKHRLGMVKLRLEGRQWGSIVKEVTRAQGQLANAENLTDRRMALERLLAARERLLSITQDNIDAGRIDADMRYAALRKEIKATEQLIDTNKQRMAAEAVRKQEEAARKAAMAAARAQWEVEEKARQKKRAAEEKEAAKKLRAEQKFAEKAARERERAASVVRPGKLSPGAFEGRLLTHAPGTRGDPIAALTRETGAVRLLAKEQLDTLRGIFETLNGRRGVLRQFQVAQMG